MAHWCALAGLPKGLTLHGLRKSLGVYLAEAEASTRQLMDVLGHDDIDHAELYSSASEAFVCACSRTTIDSSRWCDGLLALAAVTIHLRELRLKRLIEELVSMQPQKRE